MSKGPYILLLLLFATCMLLPAQKLKVAKFERSYNSTVSEQQEVRDSQGRRCALIKVRLAHYALDFPDSGVRSEYKCNNEYWVYVPASMQQMDVVCQVATPLTYTFPYKLQEGGCYIMELTVVQADERPMAPPRSIVNEGDEVYRFYTINYSTTQQGWGNSFGVGQVWGWYCSLMLRYTPQKITIVNRSYYDNYFDNELMHDYSTQKTFWSFSAVVGPSYRLMPNLIITTGVGYTYRAHEYLPGGFTGEVGATYRIATSLTLSADYECIGIGSRNASSLKLGMGFIW